MYIKLKVPEGTQSGTKFKFKDKDIENFRTKRKGSQYVIVYEEPPKNYLLQRRNYLKI